MAGIEKSAEGDTQKYHGFISYSHKDNGKFASAIRSSLLNIAKPWKKEKTLKVFLDVNDLPAGYPVKQLLEFFLDKSEWLMLLASPDITRPDSWVKKEVQWWLKNRSIDRILILLTEGEIAWDQVSNDFDWRKTNALPDELKGGFKEEPLWVDLRKGKKSLIQRSLLYLNFREKICSIAAPLLNIAKGDLLKIDIIRHQILMATYSLITILFISTLVWIYIKHIKEEHSSIINQVVNASNYHNGGDQIYALIAAIKAGKELQVKTNSFDSYLRPLVDASRWKETQAKVIGKLLEIQVKFHEKNRLEGNNDGFTVIAYSPDCPNQTRFLISGGKDGKVIVWRPDIADKPSGENTPLSLEHGGSIASLSIAPDCAAIASGGADNKIKVWETDGIFVYEIKNDGEINTLNYSPDGRWLISGDEGGKITLWNKQGKKTQSLDVYDGVRILSTDIQKCPNGKQLLLSSSASNKNPLKLWELDETLHPIINIESKDQAKIIRARLSPDCSIVAAGHKDGTISLRKLDGKTYKTEIYKTWPAHPGPVNSIDFSSDSQLIVSGGETDSSLPGNKKDNWVKLWNFAGEGIPYTLFETNDHRRAVKAVSFGKSSNTLISASADKTIRLWNIGFVPVVDKISFGSESTALNAELSPAGDRIAKIGKDNNIKFIDLKSKQTVKERPYQSPYPSGLVFGPDNIVYYWDENTHTLHNLDGGKEIVFDIDAPIQNVAFSQEKGLFAVSTGGKVFVTNSDGKTKESFRFKGNSDSTKALSFDQKGRSLGFVESNWEGRNVRFIKMNGGETKIETMHTEKINQIVFSPDGETVVTASDDRLIKLWNRKGQLLKTFEGHDNGVTNIAFHPDNIMLASSDFDGTVIVWSLNGEAIMRLNNESKANIWALKFNREGDRLIAASQDSITLWSFGLAGLLQHGCAALQDFFATNPKLSDDDKKLCSPS